MLMGVKSCLVCEEEASLAKRVSTGYVVEALLERTVSNGYEVEALLEMAVSNGYEVEALRTPSKE